MKFFEWSGGRQTATSALTKFLVCAGSFFDVYILFFPEGCKIDWHFDPVENKEHHRINVTLKGAWRFWIAGEGPVGSFQGFGSYHKFRPDIQEHRAEVFRKSIVLSIGWVKNKREE